MMIDENMAEFSKVRSALYERALRSYPDARSEDIEMMKKYLNPAPGERILGIGEGNGFFVPAILESLNGKGEYVVTDPSEYQLQNLEKSIKANNLVIRKCTAEDSKRMLELGSFDKIWSFGAFHHCPSQAVAFENMYATLKEGGLLVLGDVWRNTPLSEHFDGPVTRYCCTGHDVHFLGDTYARTIAQKAGFSTVEIVDLPIRWRFKTRRDVGIFIYDLLAMTNMERECTDVEERYEKVIRGCEQYLGIETKVSGVYLNWPMKAMVARK
ncbi:MAG: methyltransferase domain-containing protein [Candidatus Woesearchaeota archaeon]